MCPHCLCCCLTSMHLRLPGTGLLLPQLRPRFPDAGLLLSLLRLRFPAAGLLLSLLRLHFPGAALLLPQFPPDVSAPPRLRSAPVLAGCCLRPFRSVLFQMYCFQGQAASKGQVSQAHLCTAVPPVLLPAHAPDRTQFLLR